MAVLMMSLAMVLAGSSVVVGKVLVAELPVFPAAFGSLLVAFLCLVPLMAGRVDEVRRLSRRHWLYLFLQGLCGLVLFRVFLLYGLKHTGAVQAGIITGTTPAVLALLSWLLLHERLSRAALAGIACSVAGCLLINVSAAAGASQSRLAGGLLVGSAVVCEALFTVFRKRIADSVSAITNTTVLTFCGLLLLTPPAVCQLRLLPATVGLRELLAVGYYGVFATVLAYLLWTGGVGRVSGALAGATTAVMPASTVLLAALVLREPVHWSQLAGCLLIVTGILCTAGRPRRKEIVSPAGDRSSR